MTKFLKNCWYVAGWSTEFEAGKLYARTIINEPLVLMREADGTLIALSDRCPHRWAPLSMGRIERETIRCMYHGLRFAGDGRCVEVPGQETVPATLKARSFPVVERHRWTWIWMGEADRAGPALIPDAKFLDDDWRHLSFGQLDYAANYNHINDNLLDLSHIPFVHEKTLGRPVSTDGAPPPSTSGSSAQPIDRGVRYDRWRTGPANKSILQPTDSGDGDIWMSLDYVVPGIFISRIAMYPKGAAEACQSGPPGPELRAFTDTMSCQAVTPMTANTSRYFYSSGPRASDMGVSEADAIFAVAEEAFREDTVTIEAQQRMIDNYPGERMNGIAADRGLGLFRSLMSRLMADEDNESARVAAE